MNEENEHDLWTSEEVAKYLRVSPRTFMLRVSKHPSFPAPVSPAGIHPKWFADEVKHYVLSSRVKKART